MQAMETEPKRTYTRRPVTPTDEIYPEYPRPVATSIDGEEMLGGSVEIEDGAAADAAS